MDYFKLLKKIKMKALRRFLCVMLVLITLFLILSYVLISKAHIKAEYQQRQIDSLKLMYKK